MAGTSRMFRLAARKDSRTLLVVGVLCLLDSVTAARSDPVEQWVIDQTGPAAPWGKAVGDVDEDGLPDIVVGGHRPSKPDLLARILGSLGLVDNNRSTGELVWYRNPGWEKRLISAEFNVRTDVEVADVDGDARRDIVVVADQGVYWLRNPGWEAAEIATSKMSPRFHDVELSDLDRDGDLDVVLRNQSLFGYGDGDVVYVLMQDDAVWRESRVSVPHGEGLSVADLDGDGFADIVVNGVWLRNPGGGEAGASWSTVDYTTDWDWADAHIAVHDVNADGLADILLSPAEPAGGTYRISWFERSPDDDTDWREHIVDPTVESVHHAIGAGDFDGDGDADIISAEMNQGDAPNEVKVYLNAGDSRSWEKLVIGQSGSHNLQIADFDADGDVEAMGTNWQIEGYDGDYPVTVWNSTWSTARDWARFDIGNNGPYRNLFVYVEDINADDKLDVVAGRAWFENPGSIAGHWRRHEFPGDLNTGLYVDDFDGDGAPDVFGSAWGGRLSKPGYVERARARLAGTGYPGSGVRGRFVWARNLGNGRFELFENIDTLDGDYLQGIARYSDSTGSALLLSWHRPGNGIHRLRIPANPTAETWTAGKLSEFSQDEALTIADLNQDGIADVVTGTSWLDPARDWRAVSFVDAAEPPDRNAVADFDGNGYADVAVGFQAVSTTGKLALYRDAGRGKPEEEIIDELTGPMSLGIADMDGDSDLDIVAAEHNLENPRSARLLLYLNEDGVGRHWKRAIVAKGDEHHNGAVPVDVDGDGDVDIVSIGWGHSSVLIYENLGL